ncbi:MAG: short-chain dehydrogenase/reductase [Ilumatobacteraceae bacterium]|nr:short-chain dehydrogenase/reductase [Ilumatobacteraceae bacterium]MCU1390553.1 short-chain dehydrogenase/reductase [Ilumatobacteraceae bacterium]
MPSVNLPGRTAVVTGASRGFGRAIAAGLVAAGAHVVGVARDGDALAELQHELGTSFTPVVADVTDDGLAAGLIVEHRPQLLVLNAGAEPHPATIQDQTWATFSANWNVDVRHVFEFARAALLAPLEAGSAVVCMSSGAARQGSPMSGGYAGAKATVQFISAYAGAESERRALGIRFVALLPKLTSATALGSTFVDSYADYDHVDRDTFRERLGEPITAEQVADAVIRVADHGNSVAPAYLLTSDGLAAIG